MISTPLIRTAISRTAVRSFGQRSALRAPPAPSSIVGSAPAAAQSTSGTQTQSQTTTSSPSTPASGIDIGINHAHGKARKFGDA